MKDKSIFIVYVSHKFYVSYICWLIMGHCQAPGPENLLNVFDMLPGYRVSNQKKKRKKNQKCILDHPVAMGRTGEGNGNVQACWRLPLYLQRLDSRWKIAVT